MPDHGRHSEYHIGAIVLAAGSGQRFGRQKMLHRHNNKTLLSHSLQALDTNKVNACFIVTGAEGELVANTHIDFDVNFIYNPKWQQGMGTSIATGITELTTRSPTVDAALIMLGDQIYIPTSAIAALLETARNHQGKIVCARYNAINGAPCVFPRSTFDELLELGGDKGARAILNDPERSVISIEIPEAAYDIDTPEDLQT